MGNTVGPDENNSLNYKNTFIYEIACTVGLILLLLLVHIVVFFLFANN